MSTIKKLPVAIAIASVLATITAHAETYGELNDRQLDQSAIPLMGIDAPLAESAQEPDGYARAPGQTASDLIEMAGSLSATILTRQAGHHSDMFAFWPHGDSNPTHAISCVEGGRETINESTGKLNPSVQRIDLSSGAVETILRGMDRCDGIRSTAWGTILATEETDDGQGYEILEPLTTSEESVTDRAAGTIVDSMGNASTKIAKRDALPTMSWEGLTVLDNGVVIGGDELRPGTGTADTDGGAIFKFVPANLASGGEISELSQSPFVSGTAYAFQASCRDAGSSSFGQHGQGCEIGHGQWIEVSAATARADADVNGATGYYRPEDLHSDPTYSDAAYPNAVRFCWTNTGNEGAENYGEVICGIDRDPAMTDSSLPDSENGIPRVSVNRFVEGDTEFNSVDNLAFQPQTGILYVIEDHDNGDIWACLPDGPDRDIKTDGCLRIISVIDTSAEPTGFTFLPDGLSAILSIQHSDDPADGSMDVDEYPTDDLIIISGFTNPTGFLPENSLDFTSGSVSITGSNTMSFQNLTLDGGTFNAVIRFNTDGTYTIEEAAQVR